MEEEKEQEGEEARKRTRSRRRRRKNNNREKKNGRKKLGLKQNEAIKIRNRKSLVHVAEGTGVQGLNQSNVGKKSPRITNADNNAI